MKIKLLLIVFLVTSAIAEVMTIEKQTANQQVNNSQDNNQQSGNPQSGNPQSSNLKNSSQQNSKQNTVIKVNAITEFNFGNPKFDTDTDRIEVYVAPSCSHCGSFLIEQFTKFKDEHTQDVFIKLKILPYTAKDLFVMKLIQSGVQDAAMFYTIYLNYIKRTIATFNQIRPSEEQEKLYKGSATDADMIKFQVIAEEFGFDSTKIVNAIPNMDQAYEQGVMEWYKSEVAHINQINPKKELDLPLIIKNGKIYNKLEDCLNK